MNRSLFFPARASQYLFTMVNLAFWCIFLHLYWPNNGGSGLSLPFNIYAWIYALCCMGCIAVYAFSPRWRVTRALRDFTIGSAILCFLCLVTPPVWRAEARLVAASLMGGVLFYIALLQRPLVGKAYTAVLLILLGSCGLECLIFIVQYLHLPVAHFWPFPRWRNIRPYGVFQQVNLLASFVASGSLLAGILCLRLSGWRRQSVCVFQLLPGFVLHEAQSQTGYLSLLIGWLLLLFVFSSKRRLLWPLALLLLGLESGEVTRHLLNVTVIDHQQSAAVRWDVLRYSVRLIIEHPWLGWGVGSFPAVFLDHFGQFGISRMSHPHNELMMWVVEGGLVGLVGALFFIAGGVRLWWYGGRWQRAAVLAAVPVIVHMLTEYPVRLSAVHWILLILLLRCADRPVSGRSLSLPATSLLRVLLMSTALLFIPLLLATLQMERSLTQAEREGGQWRLTTALPAGSWLLASRYQFDIEMGYLQRYQHNKSSHWLNAFSRWAPGYLRVHPDANVAFTQILIAEKLRHFSAAHRLALRFCRQYPQDRRTAWLLAPQRDFNSFTVKEE